MDTQRKSSDKMPYEPIGAVLVVGGGISGMQSALDLANAGIKVYLVENSPAIGGRMAQLDKTFPTNDCSMCIVSPKLVEVGRHKNIELLTYSELESLEGEMGHFRARVRQHPRYVDPDACTGCGQCEIVCPVTHLPYFPEAQADGKKAKKKKSKNKTVIPFENQSSQKEKAPYAWTFSVDIERCKKCGICFRNCPVGAIGWEKGSPAEIRQENCIGCGACFAACPSKFSAIVVSDAPEWERSIAAAVLQRSSKLREHFKTKKNNECLRCGLCQLTCEKVMDTGAIKLGKNGIEVSRDICRVCGACVSVCPVEFLDIERMCDRQPRPLLSDFNEKLCGRKPIDIKYPQAVPRVPVIDEDSCVRLNTGACGTCQSLCDAGAIHYDQQESVREIEIGSVILSPGYEVFDATRRAEFGYGIYPNVVTSLEFERLLSASGPTTGAVLRPSDGKHPRKVAWIQCVGSRDKTCDRDYCSSVCCMYATKEAFIAKEHDENIEPTIFYIDLRSFGKNFDSYVERAKQKGVRYIRSMVSRIFEDPIAHDLELRYIDEYGQHQKEKFDMVVLSVGLQVSDSSKRLAKDLDIDLDPFGFAQTNGFAPLASSRPGVFISGVFNGPKDIPETVSEASGAASAASSSLRDARGTLARQESFPPERRFGDKDEMRIGVFICHCGINIASVVDVADVVDYAKTLDNVVYAEHPLYTCSQDTQERMRELIHEQSLTHIVVAACSPRTHEPVFQDTMQQAGLNRYMFDMANIRDQCSWVHQNDHDGATAKAKRLVAMAIANVREARALEDHVFDVTPRLLVIGGGLAGMAAAIEAESQGFEVYLVEREPHLGGMLNRLRRSLDSLSVRDHLESLSEEIERNQRIHVFAPAEVVSHSGFIGNFETEVITPAGSSRLLRHGAIVVATGGHEKQPPIFGLGVRDDVITQTELEELIENDSSRLAKYQHVAMLQCAGSRDEEILPYCSRVCCNQAIKNSLNLKKLFPELRVDILYRDIRSYGHGELNYRDARKAKVNFIRFDPDTNPLQVDSESERLAISLLDPSIRREIQLAPDLLVLSTGIEANEAEELASMLRVTRTTEGFFFEAHAKLRPVDFASDGIFMAGLAHGPKNMPETISQAEAAVARAATILSKKSLRMSGIVSQVDPEHCAVCLTCVRACPYDVPVINDQHTAEINPALCQGCGICVAECPAKTISLGRFLDENIFAKIDAYALGKNVRGGLEQKGGTL